MIPFFFDPYPDEAIYNIFLRYFKRNLNLDIESALRDLFGKKSINLGLFLPSNLDYFCNEVRKVSSYTFEYFLDKHTVYPLFHPFLTDKIKKEVINFIKYGGISNINYKLGINNQTEFQIKSIKYCQKCITEDESKYGEPYLHRVHQIPFNNICLLHNQVLSELDLPKGIKNRKFIGIEDILKNDNLQKVKIPVDANLFEKYKTLSQDIMEIIDGRLNGYNLDLIYRKYEHRLYKRNYISVMNKIRLNALIKDFEDFHTKEFLHSVNADVDVDSSVNWLATVSRRKSKIIHPLKHLLFIRFLFGSIDGFISAEENEYKFFGEGPWPCLNPVADHYMKDVVDDCKITKNDQTGNPQGTFTCSCGYIYSRSGPDESEDSRYIKNVVKAFGKVWEDKLKYYIENTDYGVYKLSKIMGCSTKSIKVYAEKLGIYDKLGLGEKAYRYRMNSQNTNEQDLLHLYKNELLEYINSNPGHSRSEIRLNRRKQWRYVAKNDKEWLEANLPEPIPHKLNFADWSKKDIELAEKVSEAISEIKKSDKNKRVTINLIQNRINYYSLGKNLNRLPITKQIVESYLGSIKSCKDNSLK
ncbi:TnsD family Tn7-like transposition protein [Clostridium thermopalmarium]|jgi:hypothetical protein|uniref:Uncharacterized protein n=1 Tax=Clostridium thermopalmarium DSM 5974 TaxID=1121340 RepID=A0A2T0AML5_9CLOT|nr:TnsD family Tn7-like transposition protein [Clostridium thermopalmarium]PRR70121.1 hypothetical protein CPAL_23420 [Clostridium thermopalmarium DSM 5974]PVZ23136.1 TniQ protein [Clostridium thermopalmarium DSM 5974]